MITHRIVVGVLTVVVACCSASSAGAQVTTGTIVGTVSDPNGIVPGCDRHHS